MKCRAFQEVRLIIYAVLIGNGIFVQYLSSMHYLCDYDGYSCSMCGMRTAINYVTSFQLKKACESNPYIVVLMVIGLLILIDSILIIKKWKNNKEPL